MTNLLEREIPTTEDPDKEKIILELCSSGCFGFDTVSKVFGSAMWEQVFLPAPHFYFVTEKENHPAPMKEQGDYF